MFCGQTTDSSFSKVIETLGHTNLSVCLLYDIILCSNDNVINGEYLVFKLHNGNMLDFKKYLT